MKRDPLLRYTIEEIQNLSEEEFEHVLNEHNAYVLNKKDFLTEENELIRNFNSAQELMDFYDAIPMDEAINNLNKLFEK